MIGQMLSHYRILQKLGEGGMGVVYLAFDTVLQRKVALKVLPAELMKDPHRLSRLVREARAASAISHPNIVHIYEIGESGGVHYVAMEYVEGVTLRAAIYKGPLELPACLKIGIQIAEALHASQLAGITHRDIKPENVMVTEAGHVKVLDFGLARAAPSSEPAAAGADVAPTASLATLPGQILGTPGYMSPEQVKGREVDSRSDLFSLGVVLYEMVTGRRPFEAASSIEVISRILGEPPEAMSHYVQGTRPELEQIVLKCLEKNPEWRYQSARDLATDLARLERDLTAPTTGRLATVPAGSKGRATRRKVLGGLAAGLLLVSAAAYVVYSLFLPHPIRSVAVLPFQNQIADRNAEYLSEGVAEALINDLSRIPDLKVTARSVVLRYRGRPVDPQATGQELKVEAVVSGTVSQRGDSLRIQVELVQVKDGVQLWGRIFDRKLADLANIQDEISREIADRLRLKLSGTLKQRLARQYAASPEAYQAYLRGLYHLNRRTLEGFEAAIGHFEQAIQKDPIYAPAYAGLADAYSLIGLYGLQPPAPVLQKAKAAALRALEFDGTLGEAYTSLAYARTLCDFDWQGAEEDYRRSIELNPNYALAHAWYGLGLLTPLGRHEESLAQLQRAGEIESGSLVSQMGLAAALYYAGRYDESLGRFQLLRQKLPHLGQIYTGVSANYWAKTMPAEALAVLESTPSGPDDLRFRLPFLAIGYVRAGRSADGAGVLRQIEAQCQHAYCPAYELAGVYLTFGDHAKALSLLQKSYERREPHFLFIKVDSMWDALRSNPAFQKLLIAARLG